MSRYALVIGSQIEGLTGVGHDTFRMHDALRERGFAVDLRFGGTATRCGILDGYDALIAKSSAGDAAVIYYSGHGLYSANSDPADPLRVVQSIAPTDLRSGGDADFRGITSWELAIKLAQLTAKTRNVTVILDCCHAAQMTRDAAARDVVVRALPHPVRMGFRRHLAALERAYGKVVLDPVGNPDVVRVVACGQTEAAFEHTNPAGRRAGVFTEALLAILGGIGDAPISWAAIGDAIRERVLRRFALQRPDVEGPSQRQLFSLAIAPRHGAVPMPRESKAFRIQTGWITGAPAGDVYTAMPLGSQAHDDARSIADTVAFQIDDDPLHRAAARSPRAWLWRRDAALRPPATAAPTAIAIRIDELAAGRDRVRSFAGRGAGLRGGFRIDALVCTRSAHRTETCVARTLRFHGGERGDGLARIFRGGIRGDGLAQIFRGDGRGEIFRGCVRDFVDVHLWISRDTTGARDLAGLLARHATNPQLHDAVTALVVAPGSAPPWITAVGASASVARIAHNLVLAVEPTALGLYRASFVARGGFGFGRHPAAGLHRTRDLAFSLVIDEVSRTGG